MGRLWTDEDQLELERWQAVQEEAANPQDFLTVRDVNINDRLRGLARYIFTAIRYRAVGGVEPFLSLQQEVGNANIARQIGPARLKENREWLEANPMVGDPFEGLFFDDD